MSEIQETLGVQAPAESQPTPEVQPNTPPSTQVTPNPIPTTPEPKAVESPEPTEAQLTGLFNDTLPELYQDNLAVKGLVAMTRTAYPDLDLARVAGKAWEMGNPAYIDYNYLREVVGDNADYLAHYFEEVVNGQVEAKKAKEQAEIQAQEEFTTQLYEDVGGKENWQRIADVYKTNAPPELMDEVDALFETGNVSLAKTAVRLIADFVKTQGALPKQGKPVVQGGVATPSVNGDALSAEQYAEALRGMRNFQGNSAQRLAKEQELKALRYKGMQLGL